MTFMIDLYGEEMFNLDTIEYFTVRRCDTNTDYNLLAIAKEGRNTNRARRQYVIAMGEQEYCKDYLKNRLSQHIVLDTDR